MEYMEKGDMQQFLKNKVGRRGRGRRRRRSVHSGGGVVVGCCRRACLPPSNCIFEVMCGMHT